LSEFIHDTFYPLQVIITMLSDASFSNDITGSHASQAMYN